MRVLEGVDGLVTAEPDVPLMALSADCPVLLLYDTHRHALGIAHTGWRGTLAGMPGKLAATLRSECHANPNAMLAVVSPSALVCCYEIKEDVWRKANDATGDADRYVRIERGKMYLDLSALIANQLLEAGLSRESIQIGRAHV